MPKFMSDSVLSAKLTILYSFAGENKSITMEIDPCEVFMECGSVEVTPVNGYRCYKATDQVSISLRGTHNAPPQA